MRKLIIAAPEYFVSVEAKLAPSIEISIYFLQKLKKEYDFILVLRTVDNISDSALQQLTETLNKRKIDYFLTDNDVHNCADLKALADEHGIAESELSKSIIFLDSDNSNEVKNIINTTLPETGEDWEKLIEKISAHKRTANVVRETNETKIEITLLLDGSGKSNISTGLDFFDHMLDQLARHGQVDLQISAKGDLHIDEHHTIEDTGLALGQAFREALGNKIGIERYGFLLPMDDCLAQVAIDFGGRPWLVWAADFKREKIGEMPTEMFFHFFKSFSDAAQCNLNIKAEGQNEHHKIESIFKAFAKAIKMAVGKTGQKNLPSTKGVL